MQRTWLRSRRVIALTGLTLLASVGNVSAAPSVGHRQSSPIALSADEKLLVNVNPDSNTVSFFDASGVAPLKLKEAKVGKDPESVALHPDNLRGYVADSFDGTVTILDLVKLKKKGKIKVGVEPRAVVLSPNGTRLYVANSVSDSLMVFDTTTKKPTLIATKDLGLLGTNPRALAVTNDGDADDADESVFVAFFFAALRPGKTSVEEGQDDQREGRVVAFSAATNTLLSAPNPITLAPLASVGFNSNGKLAPGPGQVPTVPATNPQSFTTPTGAFPNQLAAIAIHPSQLRTYVVSTGASPNGPVRFNVNVQGLVSVFTTDTRAEVTATQTGADVRQTAPLNLNQGVNLATTPAPRLFQSNPVAMAWRPDGSDAWVAIQNSDLLVRLTVDVNGIPTVAAPLVAGPSQIVRVDLRPPSDSAFPRAPRGLAINAAGTRAFVSNYVSRSVATVDIANPIAPAVIAEASSSAFPESGTKEDLAQLGKALFFTGRGPGTRMSSESWGGCVTCHPDGLTDNVTWMFDGGPRQTIPLDGTFNKKKPFDERVLNWSAVRDEIQDFELNTRNVFGGRGLIDDDRLFFALGGASGATPADSALIEQFQQVTGAVGTTNDLVGSAPLPPIIGARRDFGSATLSDGRIFIIGGRTGPGGGALVSGPEAIIEFDPHTNNWTPRNNGGFTARHSLGAAAVTTNLGPRIYAIGGYGSTSNAAPPLGTVEEYNPATGVWRPVASLPTAVAQFGITVAGGINTAEPLQLIHVVSGNTGSEAAPSVANPNPIQRFAADPLGPGVFSGFNPPITLRRNHGAATALRGVSSRIFVIGGQDAAGTVLDTVDEYQAQAATAVLTPHTSLPAPRARFGIAGTASTNQIYVMGGVDGGGTDQSTVFEYTIANQGPVAGPPGTPSGAWVTRAVLSLARSGLQTSTPPAVTNFLVVANAGRSSLQDTIAEYVKTIRPLRAPVPKSDKAANRGKKLFKEKGLVVAEFSCATCHGGKRWSRSTVDFPPPPSPEVGLGFGDERVIGAELRETATQPETSVLLNVGTFTLGGGRVNEIRVNAADAGQAIAPLGANGFNIPSLLSLHASAPYFYSGLAQTLEQVLDGSQDGNGGTPHHVVADAQQRADLIAFLRSIDQKTSTFK